MKVYELIEELNKIKDKNRDIDLMLEIGYGEYASCDSGFSVDSVNDEVVVLFGEGNWCS